MRRRPVALLLLVAAFGVVLGACRPAAPVPGGTVERGIVYAQHGASPLLLDAYLPPGTAAAPAVVMVHGGGWVSGGRAEYAGIAPSFVRSGLAAFAVDYTLSSATRRGWPVQVDELLAAVRWIRRHAAALHVNPRRIGIMGDSSGANLALAAAMEVGGDARTGIQAAAGWSGPYDLVTFRPSPTLLDGTGARLQTDVAWLTGCLPLDAPQCLALQADASPARHARRDAPPVLLASSDEYAQHCEIVDPTQTEAMAGALRAVDVPVELDVVHRCAHAMGYRQVEVGRTVAFFVRRLGAGRVPAGRSGQATGSKTSVGEVPPDTAASGTGSPGTGSPDRVPVAVRRT